MNGTRPPRYTGEQKTLMVLIVIVVFPAVFRLFWFMLAFPAKLLISPLLLDGNAGRQVFGVSGSIVDVVAIIVAFAGALQLCRMVWPKTQDSEKAQPSSTGDSSTRGAGLGTPNK